jgi:arylformamidase
LPKERELASQSRQVIHDITLPFSAAVPVWPGDPSIEIRPVMRTANGDSCNASQIICPTHCGTHVDPPFHFVHDGARLDEVPLERWIGPCQVIELPTGIAAIEPEHLETVGIVAETTRLLFKTANSTKWAKRPLLFETDYVALSFAAARWLIASRIQLIGVDYFSFEAYSDTVDDVHRAILGAGIIAIEALDLSAIAPGFYDLICLPLRLVDGDGAPARVILIEHLDRDAST